MLAATKEKLKLTVRKGRALEKGRDQLRAELAERDAPQAAVRSDPAFFCRMVQQAVEPSHQTLAVHAGETQRAAGFITGQLHAMARGGGVRGNSASRVNQCGVASEGFDGMQVSDGDVAPAAGCAHGTAAADEGPAGDDLNEQLAAAQARLVEAAEEAADLRNRLTALAEAEASRGAAQAQVRFTVRIGVQGG